jgi:hypothetical protein
VVLRQRADAERIEERSVRVEEHRPGPWVAHRSRLPCGSVSASARRIDAKGDPAMCRNIRTLHNFEPPATEDEVHASALQYVRKISGFTKPSQVNTEAFERAVAAVTEVSQRLLAELQTGAPPKNREVEAAKARARAAKRYAA